MKIIRLKEGETVDFSDTTMERPCLVVPSSLDEEADNQVHNGLYNSHYFFEDTEKGWFSLPDELAAAILRLHKANGEEVPVPSGGVLKDIHDKLYKMGRKPKSMPDDSLRGIKIDEKLKKLTEAIDKNRREDLDILQDALEKFIGETTVSHPQFASTPVEATFGGKPSEVIMKFGADR